MFELTFIKTRKNHPQDDLWGFYNSKMSFINSKKYHHHGGDILHKIQNYLGVIYSTGGGIMSFFAEVLYSKIDGNLNLLHHFC